MITQQQYDELKAENDALADEAHEMRQENLGLALELVNAKTKLSRLQESLAEVAPQLCWMFCENDS